MRREFKINFIILSIITLMPLSLFAQVQKGVVKAKGRLDNNGIVIKGKPLSGAVVTVKGRNAVISGNDGKFDLSLTKKSFYLQDVHKQGYVLTDPESVSRQYDYSSNPLVLVLEDEKRFLEDIQAAKDRIRETLFLQYRQQNEELKRKLAENEIRKDEYDKMKNKLDSLQDNNETLIKTMAEEYARIDYDQMNEVMAQVLQFIFNGELTRADSLLKAEGGNLDSEIKTFLDFQDKNAQKRSEQIRRDSVERYQKDALAQRCYAKHQLFKLRHLNDSARHYIELRAALDTTNVKWQLEAGIYIEEFCIDELDSIWISPDNKGAMVYYRRALNNAITQYGENSPIVGRCYSRIANAVDETLTDVMYYARALSIMQFCYGEESIEAADIWRRMGQTYNSWHPDTGLDFEEADSCFKQAIKIYDKHYGKNNLESLLCYLESEPGDGYVKKITHLLDGYGPDKQLEIIRIYRNIARKYDFDVAKAERAHSEVYYFGVNKTDENENYLFDEFDSEDWKVWKKGYTNMIKGDKYVIKCFENSIFYHEKVVALMTAVYGDDYIPVLTAKQTIELAIDEMKYYQEEMQEAENNLEIARKYKKR